MDNGMQAKVVLLVVALLTFTAVNGDEEQPYESADGICSKCNCTSVNSTLEDGASENMFTLDCSRKSFTHLFAKWPEEMSENESGTKLIFIMSLSSIETLQQFPTTNATIYFTCRHCKISTIQSHAFIDAPNILGLDLAYNQIESKSLFPEIFKGPESDEEYAPIKLETLDLSHNAISFLEKILFEHTPHLRSLDLSYNPINSFDEPTEQALRSLHKLEILDLSGTGIMELPLAILEHLEKLSELFLNSNKFLTIPESLSSVGKSLEYLHLGHNPIEIINEESFVGLAELKQLNISSMPMLREITKNSFKDLVSLEVLYCHNNVKLSSFNMEDLLVMRHLKEVDVSRNALTSLDFSENDLEQIAKENETSKADDALEHHFSKLRVLKLIGNPWHCDCSMMKGLEIFGHNATNYQKIIKTDEARCKTPYELASKLLYNLPIDYVCARSLNQKAAKIPIYDPPQFLRPKSIMLTVFSVVGVVVLGIIVGFLIVCIKRRLKPSENNFTASPIRYTTVRDSTISNVANTPYSQ